MNTLPEWVDKSEYPFNSQYLKLPAGMMHYVDEGQGETVVMVHGTPTWSFLYRKIIKTLSKNYRCLAPDHLGFGLSDKPDYFSYKPEHHARNLEKWIEDLNLKKITLIVHDFGGPIGLHYALNHPENVKKLVIMNSFMWSLENDKHFKQASQLLGSAFGRFLYKRWNFSPKVMLKISFGDKSKLTKHIHNHYLKAFPTPQSRTSTAVLAKELIGSSNWFDSLWKLSSNITNIPTLLLWGTKDTAFREIELEKFEGLFTKRTVVRLPECGHFVQEECEEAGTIIKEWMEM
ncbi:MAG: alpha/beta fold hydrolase [Bacteroidetes bacterium]|nr:alpha/beta fold hydrolase [Bacteroidota bacterium]